MFRRFLATAGLLAGMLAAPVPAAWSLSDSGLRARLAAQMRHAGGAASAYVARIDGDERLYSRRANRALIPASVNKLFVTATALRRFGPRERLDTTVLADGAIDERGVLDGDLYLRGGGDPTLTGERVAALAGELAAQGLTRVTGRVYGDESLFDALRGSTNTGHRPDWEVGGQLGALVIGRGYAGRGWQRRPAAVAADALLRALEEADIPVRGRASVGVAPQDAQELATTSSAPMAELMLRTNGPSDNYYAETLLKLLGAHFGGGGTTGDGAEVVQEELGALDVRPTVVDGSGLSRSDRTSSRHVVMLLDAMVESELGPDFLDSLAVAGRSGTLRYRMRSSHAAGRCRGKTGTLRDVSNVAGVCTTAGGQTVAFSILMNSVTPSRARAIQDRMLSAIAQLR